MSSKKALPKGRKAGKDVADVDESPDELDSPDSPASQREQGQRSRSTERGPRQARERSSSPRRSASRPTTGETKDTPVSPAQRPRPLASASKQTVGQTPITPLPGAPATLRYPPGSASGVPPTPFLLPSSGAGSGSFAPATEVKIERKGDASVADAVARASVAAAQADLRFLGSDNPLRTGVPLQIPAGVLPAAAPPGQLASTLRQSSARRSIAFGTSPAAAAAAPGSGSMLAALGRSGTPSASTAVLPAQQQEPGPWELPAHLQIPGIDSGPINIDLANLNAEAKQVESLGKDLVQYVSAGALTTQPTVQAQLLATITQHRDVIARMGIDMGNVRVGLIRMAQAIILLQQRLEASNQQIIVFQQEAQNRLNRLERAGVQAEGEKAKAGAMQDENQRLITDARSKTVQIDDLQRTISVLNSELVGIETGVDAAVKAAQAMSLGFVFSADATTRARKVGEITAFYRRELDKARAALIVKESDANGEKAKAAELEKQLGGLRSQLDELQRARAKDTGMVAEYKAQAAKAQAEAAVSQSRADRLVAEVDAAKAENAIINKNFEDHLAAAVAKATDSKSIEPVLAELRAQVAAQTQKAVDAEALRKQDTEALQETIKTTKGKLAASESAVDSARTEYRAMQDQLNAENKKVREGQAQLDKLTAENARLQQELARRDQALKPGDVVRAAAPGGDLGQRLIEPPGFRNITIYDSLYAAAQVAAAKAAAARIVDVKVPASAPPPPPVFPDVAPPAPDVAPPPNFVLVADAKDRKADIPVDVDLVNAMDVSRDPEPGGGAMVVSPAQASQDAMRAMILAAGGDFGIDREKRYPYAEDLLDIDAVCQDRSWTMAIVDLLRESKLYSPIEPLEKQLEYIYSAAQDGSTELLFVLELLMVFNLMKDRVSSKESFIDHRVHHLQSFVEYHVRRPLQDFPVMSHVSRITTAVINNLDLIKSTSEKARERTALFWWTDSPLATTILGGYGENNKELLVDHSTALRLMFSKNSNTFRVLWASLSFDQRFIYVFQELCGTLWNASNFRSNFNTVMDQPGGAFLMDLFMRAANTPMYNTYFNTPGTPEFEMRRRVYYDLYSKIAASRGIGDRHAAIAMGETVIGGILNDVLRLRDRFESPKSIEVSRAPPLLTP